MTLVALGVAAVGWSGLSGCDSGSPNKAASAKPTPTGPVLPGVVYLVSGPTLLTGDLWRLRDGKAEQLTDFEGGRISHVTAGSGEVMVAEASSGADQIARLMGDRLEPYIQDRVFTPALSSDGRLAYSIYRYTEASGRLPSGSAIMARDLETGAERVAYEIGDGQTLGYPAFGPDGLLAADLNADFPNAAVIVIGPDGTVRHRLPHPGGTQVFWQPGPLPLVTNGEGTSFLWDPATGNQTPVAPGWVPITWSPDGTQLLVAQGQELGRVKPSDPSRVESLGRFGPGPVYLGAWVANDG